MWACVYEKPGEPIDVVNLIEKPMPRVGPTQVLVKMIQAPIVPADMATIRGSYRTPQKLPTVPGYSGQGRIVEIGSEVRFFKEEDQIIIRGFKKPSWQEGSFQEYVAVEENELILVPKGLNIDDTFDFINTPLTAWVMVTQKLNVQPQQTVLVSAAGSCVGRLVLRLSQARKYRAIGITRRDEQIPELKQIGASEVINMKTEDIEKRAMSLTQLKGVDHAIDAIGGEVASACFKSLGENGKMIAYGLLDRERYSSIDIRKMLFYNLELMGFWIPGWWFSVDALSRNHAIEQTFELIASGILKSDVEKKYNIRDYKQALTHAEQSGNRGRVALIFD